MSILFPPPNLLSFPTTLLNPYASQRQLVELAQSQLVKLPFFTKVNGTRRKKTGGSILCAPIPPYSKARILICEDLLGGPNCSCGCFQFYYPREVLTQLYKGTCLRIFPQCFFFFFAVFFFFSPGGRRKLEWTQMCAPGEEIDKMCWVYTLGY